MVASNQRTTRDKLWIGLHRIPKWSPSIKMRIFFFCYETSLNKNGSRVNLNNSHIFCRRCKQVCMRDFSGFHYYLPCHVHISYIFILPVTKTTQKHLMGSSTGIHMWKRDMIWFVSRELGNVRSHVDKILCTGFPAWLTPVLRWFSREFVCVCVCVYVCVCVRTCACLCVDVCVVLQERVTVREEG